MAWLWAKKVPYIPQMEFAECGAASLAMILGYHGHWASMPELRDACKVAREGANAASIMEAASAYGLQAEAVRLELDSLPALSLPAILHWQFKHFLVLERVTPGRSATLVDPSAGRRQVTWAELERSFTGVAIMFAPIPGVFKSRGRTQPSLKRHVDLIRDLVPSLGQVMGASLMLQVMSLVLPVANQLLVDQVIGPKQERWLWGLGLALGVASITKLFLTLLRAWVLQGIQYRLDLSLMGRFVRHLLALPLGFFLQRQPGDLLQRVESNSDLRDLFSDGSISAILDALQVLGFSTLMLLYNARLGGVVILLGAIRVAFMLALRRRNQEAKTTEQSTSGQTMSILVEALTGMETLKARGGQDLAAERYAHRIAKQLNAQTDRKALAISSTQLMTFLGGTSLAAVFFLGGQEVLAERMTLGVFTAFITLQSLFMAPLENLLRALTQFQYLSAGLQRLDDVMEQPVEPTGTMDPGRLKGAIQLENVSFRYGPGTPLVVQDINITVTPGEKIAIVGRSGAGKSTLARLLLGMHPPTTGAIYFDGYDLRELDLVLFRRQVGMVLQESFVFDDTVTANISLQNDRINREHVREVARLACIDTAIQRLPQGYHTRLGENASTLSGGERQRLCLARALASDPAILLLDEATSSLDLETEARVHANLASRACTRILIAHRLATVKDADRIFVMEDGRVVQEGIFAALASQSGPFQDLLRAMEANRE